MHNKKSGTHFVHLQELKSLQINRGWGGGGDLNSIWIRFYQANALQIADWARFAFREIFTTKLCIN